MLANLTTSVSINFVSKFFATLRLEVPKSVFVVISRSDPNLNIIFLRSPQFKNSNCLSTGISDIDSISSSSSGFFLFAEKQTQ